MCCGHIVELQVTANNINTECCTTTFLAQIYFAGKNKTYLLIYTKSPIFRTHFNRIVSFCRDFRKIPYYQFSRKSVQRCADTCGRTDREMGLRKLTWAFRDYRKTPKMAAYLHKTKIMIL